MKKFELCPAFLSSSTTLVHATNIMYIVWFLSSLVLYNNLVNSNCTCALADKIGTNPGRCCLRPSHNYRHVAVTNSILYQNHNIYNNVYRQNSHSKHLEKETRPRHPATVVGSSTSTTMKFHPRPHFRLWMKASVALISLWQLSLFVHVRCHFQHVSLSKWLS